MSFRENAKIIKTGCLGTGIYEIWFETSDIAKAAKPGQFISVYSTDGSRLLPRPISICAIVDNKLRIVYRTVGAGTKEFSSMKEGESLSIQGPLGNGYDVNATYASKDAIIFGGGIGIPPMLSTVFFPELLIAFHDQYPEIAVVLEEYGSVRACNLVQDDTLDLALVNMEQYNIDKFNKALLANDQVVFCVSDDHRLADKEVVTTKEMSKESLIFFNADSVQNQLLKTRFETDGYVPDIIMRSSQIYTILQLVKTCKYGSFLYSSMTDKFASSGIKGIPLSPPIRIKIGMIWKKGKYISDNMQKFLNFTKMYYREHPLIQKL